MIAFRGFSAVPTPFCPGALTKVNPMKRRAQEGSTDPYSAINHGALFLCLSLNQHRLVGRTVTVTCVVLSIFPAIDPPMPMPRSIARACRIGVAGVGRWCWHRVGSVVAIGRRTKSRGRGHRRRRAICAPSRKGDLPARLGMDSVGEPCAPLRRAVRARRGAACLAELVTNRYLRYYCVADSRINRQGI